MATPPLLPALLLAPSHRLFLPFALGPVATHERPDEFPDIGQPDFDCGRMCAAPPTAGLPCQRSGVCSQLGRHPSCEFAPQHSLKFIPAAPLPRGYVTAAEICLEQRVIRWLTIALSRALPCRPPTAGCRPIQPPVFGRQRVPQTATLQCRRILA
jgi:hypothetical protein